MSQSRHCPKAVCQIKASKVISDNQYWQRFPLKPCCVGRYWDGGRLIFLPFAQTCFENAQKRGSATWSGIPGFQMPVRLPVSLCGPAASVLQSLEVKTSARSRISWPLSDAPRIRTFQVPSSIPRPPGEAWF